MIMWYTSCLLQVFLLFFLFHGFHANKVFKVFRITPENEEQLVFLRNLYQTASEYGLDFWKGPRAVGAVCDVMVPPGLIQTFPRILTEKNIPYTLTINDVQKLIEEREKKSKARASFGPLLRDESSGSQPRYDFSRYHPFHTMRDYLRSLARAHPQISELIRLGTSHEGRVIEAIKIGNPINDDRKRVIWIDGGIHAREWAASTVALFFVKELLTKYDTDPEIKHYVDHLNWVIAPQVNPDGYEFSRSGTHPTKRLWRKNMSPAKCIYNRFGRKKCCPGVDLNRNFDFHWGESGSSTNPCDEIYQGNSSFSEPESRAIRDYVRPRRHLTDAFITLHTYAQIWAHAFGHARREYPTDVSDLRRVGLEASKALKKMYGTEYKVGSGADTLYPAAGGSDDWAKDVMGIKFVYLLELRPDDSEWEGFILNENQLVPTARETFEAVKVVANEVMKRKGIPLYRPAGQRQPSNYRGRFSGNSRTEEPCSNKRRACERWVQSNPNLCQSIRHFMQEQCALACKLC